MAGETPDVPVIRQQPGVKELDRVQAAPVTGSTKQVPYYGEVYSNAVDAQTNMVRLGDKYTWDNFTASTAFTGNPGHIRFYDRRSGRFGRVPFLHSVIDD